MHDQYSEDKGYMDTVGEWAISPDTIKGNVADFRGQGEGTDYWKINELTPFCEGYAVIQVNNEYYIINEGGAVLSALSERGAILHPCTDGWFYCHMSPRSGRDNFIDAYGNYLFGADVMVESGYDITGINVEGPFSEGLALLESNSENRIQRYCNTHGEMAIAENPAVYYYGQFHNGRALALDSETDLYGYIDETGIWAIAPQYTYANDFHAGYAVAYTDYPSNSPTQEDTKLRLIIDTAGAEISQSEGSAADGDLVFHHIFEQNYAEYNTWMD